MKQIVILLLSASLCLADKLTGRNLSKIPKTSFTCNGRGNGYFADIEADCQAYHLCDGGGRQYTYLCPNQTLFNQRMLICDHWYQVECSISADFYSKNSLIGNQEKNFLNEEENSNPSKRVSGGQSFPEHLASQNIAASQISGNTNFGQHKLSPKPVNPTLFNLVLSTTPLTTDFTEVRDSVIHETSTVSSLEAVELHTNGDELTTIVQEERITLSKLISPNKVPQTNKVPQINTSQTNEQKRDNAGGSQKPHAPNSNIVPSRFVEDNIKAVHKNLPTVSNILPNNSHGNAALSTDLPSVLSVADDSDESDEVIEGPKSLFDIEIPELEGLKPGTLEFELVSLAHSTDDAVTTLGFTPEDTDVSTGQAGGRITADETTTGHDAHHDHAHTDGQAQTLEKEFVELLDMRRIFFIPADDHTMPPIDENVINVQLNNIKEGPTMKFKEKSFFEKLVQKSGRVLDPNPNCPQCHPNFLQPGQCIPCVIIR